MQGTAEQASIHHRLQLTLVDHNALALSQSHFGHSVVSIIDHHPVCMHAIWEVLKHQHYFARKECRVSMP